MKSLRSLVLVTLFALLVAACGSSGGSSGSDSAAQPSAPAAESTAGGAGAEPTSGDAAAEPTVDAGAASEPTAPAGGVAAGIPEIAAGQWGAGTATAEMSGDVSMTMKAAMPAGLGYTMDGLTGFVFTSDDQGSVINITLSQAEQTGFAVTSTPANVSTAGTWGVGGCGVDITRNDASGIAGSFSCNGIPAIAITEAKSYTVDLKGSFEVAR